MSLHIVYLRRCIKSFVVQNFSKTYPFLEKSPRHNYDIILFNTKPLLVHLIKSIKSLKPATNGYFSFFRMYNFFTNVFTITFTTNLLLSSKYVMFKRLWDVLVFGTKTINTQTQQLPNNLKFTHKYIVKCTSLNFKKNHYNTLLYTHMFVLITNYFTCVNNFTINTIHTCINPNLTFYMFINLFYFKIRNY